MPVEWRGVIIADPGIPSPLNHGIGFQLADRTRKVADGNASKAHRSHVEVNAAEFAFLGWNHFSFSFGWWKEQPLLSRSLTTLASEFHSSVPWKNQIVTRTPLSPVP